MGEVAGVACPSPSGTTTRCFSGRFSVTSHRIRAVGRACAKPGSPRPAEPSGAGQGRQNRRRSDRRQRPPETLSYLEPDHRPWRRHLAPDQLDDVRSGFVVLSARLLVDA